MNGTAGLTNDASATTNGGATNAAAGGPGQSSGATLSAWERFVSGEDTIRGVRPEILASWYRCREQYQVDPHLAQAPPAPGEGPGQGEHSLLHGTVFAELGGAAAMAATDAEALGGIITVTDSDGRILATWGDRKTLGLAEESNLAPWSAWPEWTTGTNGMGTALECHQPVIVEGAEHWCQGFHGWACAGVAIRDAATDKAIAVLNVSLRGPEIPVRLAGWLRQNAATVQAILRKRERQSGIELVAAFARAAAGAQGPVAAVDMAGRVVIANDEAGLLFGVPSRTPAADPASRWVSQVRELAGLAQHATRKARYDPHWTGSTRVYIPFIQAPLPVSVSPVFQSHQMIGLLLTGGSADGDPVDTPESEPLASRLPGRVIARRDDRLVVLALREIRYAESDGNIVWLATDQGRLRANAHGLDNLEHELDGCGFLRVHRRFLVNLRRIKEIDQGFKGSLYLITEVRTHETVPVSRRHAPVLRRALGV
ncbi:MAG: LytTR family transcriptional regulator DNA-binding domain-containing protein [Streptosporangiaceae bacterium]|nr:LytTR family transcriptional regulator DNA-binding domain-containing protein [Streptosporangiaceae bacterium]